MANNILNENFFFTDKNSKTKKEIFENALDILVNAKRILSKKNVLQSIFHRESLGATGIGEGVAIPHGESTEVLVPTILFIQLNHPVVWESPDENLVDQVILFIVNGSYENQYYKSIRKIMSSLGDDAFLKKVKSADLNKIFILFNDIVEREENEFA